MTVCSALQLENAAANVLARFHQVDEDGQEQDFTGLQVLLYSSKNFGPMSLRNLSVRLPMAQIIHQIKEDGHLLLPQQNTIPKGCLLIKRFKV